jgi:hypothetical protein
MHHAPRLFSVAAAISILLNCTLPRLASAEGCPGCASNSPIINSFAVMWLRGQSMPVLSNHSTCKKADQRGAHLAIVKLDDNAKSKMRGYQLVVTVGDTILCSGSELTGIVFQLSSRYGEPAMIRQVAKTQLISNQFEKGAQHVDEYRFMYLVSPAGRPDDSLCSRGLNDSRLRRAKRRLLPYHIPEFQQPETTPDSDSLFEVYRDRLMDYAVIIPNAEYDDRGEPQPQVAKTQRPDDTWFEFACAEGALAHTDLTGLVDVGARQEVRTAAIRMFRAQYDGEEAATQDGTPIAYARGELSQSPGSTLPPSEISAQTLTRFPDVGDIEAKWDSTGAVCVSHSRLWMRDSIIADAKPVPANTPRPNMTRLLEQAEDDFVNQFHKSKCDDKFKGYFTSRVIHHIVHTSPTPASRASGPKR